MTNAAILTLFDEAAAAYGTDNASKNASDALL